MIKNPYTNNNSFTNIPTSRSCNTCSDVAGVWSRVWEEDPLGGGRGAAADGGDENVDRTTMVLWTQTAESGIYSFQRDLQGEQTQFFLLRPIIHGNMYSIKIPRRYGHLQLPLQSLNTSDKNDFLYNLARIKSFAGILKYNLGDVSPSSGLALEKDTVLATLSKDEQAALPLSTCQWERKIDFQPPSDVLDIGLCVSYSKKLSDGSLDIRETGDDASYAEGWHRLPNTFQGPFFAMSLVSEVTSTGDSTHECSRQGFWVRAGSYFAYAIGRPEHDDLIQFQVGKTLFDILKGARSEEEQLQVLGNYVAVFGEIDEHGKWNIMHSTNPALIGCYLIGMESGMKKQNDLCCSTIMHRPQSSVSVGDYVQQVIYGHGDFTRTWKVIELYGCCIP